MGEAQGPVRVRAPHPDALVRQDPQRAAPRLEHREIRSPPPISTTIPSPSTTRRPAPRPRAPTATRPPRTPRACRPRPDPPPPARPARAPCGRPRAAGQHAGQALARFRLGPQAQPRQDLAHQLHQRHAAARELARLAHHGRAQHPLDRAQEAPLAPRDQGVHGLRAEQHALGAIVEEDCRRH
jgi:hypothetical protein